MQGWPLVNMKVAISGYEGGPVFFFIKNTLGSISAAGKQ